MTTIAAENLKNIRQSMDVLITIELADGTTLTINNANLINCVVSLRSDLSKWEPTLPESEIEINAFFDNDMSEEVANIPDGTPVTYSAGYAGDMSPTRYFYTDEQITWADNVLHIHAVDQVHLLDEEIPPILFGQEWDGVLAEETTSPKNQYSNVLRKFYSMFCEAIEPYYAVIDHLVKEEAPDTTHATLNYQCLIFPRQTAREFVAMMQSWFHITFWYSGVDAFWPTYVDAGIPTITWTRPTSKWIIDESDCGNVERKIDRNITNYALNVASVSRSGFKTQPYDCSGTLFYNGGIAADYTDYTTYALFGLRYELNDVNAFSTVPGGNTDYDYTRVLPHVDHVVDDPAWYLANAYGKYLLDGSVENNLFYPNPGLSWLNISWDSTMTSLWNSWKTNGYIDNDASSSDLESYCRFYTVTEKANTLNIVDTSHAPTGGSMEIDAPYFGEMLIAPRRSSVLITTTLPRRGLVDIAERSNETGSFIWKGNPKIQPRDVFTFHRLDGTDEDCTIENITITHAGGGTTAEITYRKGIC